MEEKKQAENVIYQICLGERSRLYDFCIQSAREYADRIGAFHVTLHEPQLRIRPGRNNNRSTEAVERLGYLPIYEKLNGLRYLSDCNALLLDADVWVRPDAPDIFKDLNGADFAGVPERSLPSNVRHRRKLKGYSRSQYQRLHDVPWDWKEETADFYNLGVSLYGKSFNRFLEGQTPAEFMKRPEFQRFIDGEGAWKWSTEQTMMNWFIRKSGATRWNLDWKWNALYGVLEKERYKEAYFVHFFLKTHLPHQGENVEELVRNFY